MTDTPDPRSAAAVIARIRSQMAARPPETNERQRHRFAILDAAAEASVAQRRLSDAEADYAAEAAWLADHDQEWFAFWEQHRAKPQSGLTFEDVREMVRRLSEGTR